MATISLVRVPTAHGSRLAEMVSGAFGPLLRQWIANPTVEDIALNPDGVLWAKREGESWEHIGEMAEPDAVTLINAIAGLRGAIVNKESPILETELPEYGLRFEGLRPPVVHRACFSIRKIASSVYPLGSYVDSGIMTQRQHDVLIEAIRERENILLAGGPGSGKTTLLNGLLCAVTAECPDDRIVTIEDTLELKTSSPNTMALHAGGGLTMLDCLKASLRVRATRIVVGEVRDAEANAMLKAWNTGHPGSLATLHASSAAQALSRLESLVRESSRAVRNARSLIADAVQIVVFVSAEKDRALYPKGRRVREIVAVKGLLGNHRYRLEEVAV